MENAWHCCSMLPFFVYRHCLRHCRFRRRRIRRPLRRWHRSRHHRRRWRLRRRHRRLIEIFLKAAIYHIEMRISLANI